MTDAPRQRVRTAPPAPAPTTVAPAAAKPAKVYEHPELDEVRKSIHGRFGANVMRKATAMPSFCHTETGIFMLDLALLGGMPEGLVTQIYGYPSCGKTTTALRIVGNTQKKYPEKVAVWVDFEQTLDLVWGQKHGINTDTLEVVNPRSGEHGVDIIDALIRTPEVSIIVVDSLPSIVPMKEGSSSAEDDHYALRARLVGKLCSKILDATMEAKESGFYPSVIFINQWRTKIGGMGDPRTLPCGNQHQFLSMVMFEIKNKEEIGKNARGMDIVEKNNHSFVIKKNKTGNSIRSGEFTMIRNPDHPLGEATIDEAEEVVKLGKKFGFVAGGGASQTVEGSELKFKNMKEIEAFLVRNPPIYQDLKRKILMAHRADMGLPMLPKDNYLLGFVDVVEEDDD